jgi:hypothetical protein
VVGHESVDPKPQEKSDLVYWRDFRVICWGAKERESGGVKSLSLSLSFRFTSNAYLSEAPLGLGERESGPNSGTRQWLRPTKYELTLVFSVAVTRHKPKKLSSTPGRVFFSA